MRLEDGDGDGNGDGVGGGGVETTTKVLSSRFLCRRPVSLRYQEGI